MVGPSCSCAPRPAQRILRRPRSLARRSGLDTGGVMRCRPPTLATIRGLGFLSVTGAGHRDEHFGTVLSSGRRLAGPASSGAKRLIVRRLRLDREAQQLTCNWPRVCSAPVERPQFDIEPFDRTDPDRNEHTTYIEWWRTCGFSCQYCNPQREPQTVPHHRDGVSRRHPGPGSGNAPPKWNSPKIDHSSGRVSTAPVAEARSLDAPRRGTSWTAKWMNLDARRRMRRSNRSTCVEAGRGVRACGAR